MTTPDSSPTRPGRAGKQAWRDIAGERSSLRRRLVGLAALLATTAAVVLVLIVQVALSRSSQDAVARVLHDRAQAVINSAAATSPPGRLSVPDVRMDPGVAVYDARGRLVAGVVPPSQAATFGALSRSSTARRTQLGDSFALLAQPFATPSGARGVVVISERLDSFQDIIHGALAISVAIGVAIVALATGLVAWVSRRALAPVEQMAHTAEAWSEHDLDRRFELGAPTDEIRTLGHTLDHLLDRVRRAILDEQRLTSELAHELRTPLTAVLATAEITSRRKDLDDDLREDLDYIVGSCHSMAATITGLVDLARSGSTGARADDSDLDALVLTLLRDLADASRVTVLLDQGLTVAVPAALAARAIGPVLENAVRLAQHVRVTGDRVDGWITLRVSDDGPGVDVAQAEAIFVPGQTGGSGSGLGLALSRRVARSAGGEVSLVQDGGNGATFEIRLPAA